MFLDISKWQSVCNFLVEKLDDSVKVGPPEFIQSTTVLEQLRLLLVVIIINTKVNQPTQFLNFSPKYLVLVFFQTTSQSSCC